MNTENLAYSLVQLIHNFGAAAVVGGAVFAIWPKHQETTASYAMAWAVTIGWAAQIASGFGLGAVSLYFYGALPDIQGVAVIALSIKIASAIIGLTVAASYLAKAGGWEAATRLKVWRLLAALGVIALGAAAFLRWYS